MVQETPAVVKIQQVCGAGGVDIHLKRKRDRAEGLWRSLSVLSGTESFSNPIPPLCGVVAYLCFGGIASGKRKKPENHLVASDIF